MPVPEFVSRNENTKDVVVTHFNDMPTIIDGPGDYVTRDGSKASVREVGNMTQSLREHTTKMAAQGSIWKMYRGKLRPRGVHSWHICGRGFPLEEKPTDIVGKWPKDQA